MMTKFFLHIRLGFINCRHNLYAWKRLIFSKSVSGLVFWYNLNGLGYWTFCHYLISCRNRNAKPRREEW